LDAKQAERRFIETMSSWLVSLPFDLKVLYDAADDENLDRSIRETAVGAVIYVISPNDFIADRYDSFASYCDDVIMVRIALQRALSRGGEDAARFRSRFPEFFDDLPEELAVCEAVMGDLYPWLSSKVASLHKLEYKGKSVSSYLDDDEAGELLYEEGLGFSTEYPVEEEMLADRLKKASTILEVIRRRKAEETRPG
jgi:uncharacterized membrane protein YkvA (DUF1232 family)